ncbi:MAG: hypothetical protein R2932_56525 [Caldilineaceae bacterium]
MRILIGHGRRHSAVIPALFHWQQLGNGEHDPVGVLFGGLVLVQAQRRAKAYNDLWTSTKL